MKTWSRFFLLLNNNELIVILSSSKQNTKRQHVIYDPTMMLLMGMWINLTKNPMKPMMQNPIAVAIAIFWNSFRSGFVQRLINRMESLANERPGS